MMFKCRLMVILRHIFNVFNLPHFYFTLTLCMLSNNFSRRHFEICSYFSKKNRMWHFMQIVFLWDNLHEKVISYLLGIIRKHITSMSSAEFALIMVRANITNIKAITWICKMRATSLAMVAYLRSVKRGKKRFTRRGGISTKTFVR